MKYVYTIKKDDPLRGEWEIDCFLPLRTLAFPGSVEETRAWEIEKQTTPGRIESLASAINSIKIRAQFDQSIVGPLIVDFEGEDLTRRILGDYIKAFSPDKLKDFVAKSKLHI